MKFSFRAYLACFLFVAFFSATAIGQNHHFLIKNIKYTEDNRDLDFPVVAKDSTNALTIEKINQHLQLSELELLKGFQIKNIFEKVTKNDGSIYGGKYDMSFLVFTNNKRVLSIGFSETSSGMTTAYWNRYYTFNSGNGDLVQLSDLLTIDGYKKFHSYAIKKIIRHFRRQLINNGKENIQSRDEVIEKLEEMDLTDFYIKGSSITIDGEDCLSKHQKGPDMLVEFKLAEFKSYLNDYGKCVFGINQENIGSYRSRSLPQLFSGSIDKYPILLIVRNIGGDDYEGIYCYKKFGTGIYMTGQIKNGQINLQEKNANFDDIATINGKIDANTISATWQKNDKSQPLKLFADRK